ncbi:hypothetical protein ABPG75_003769 [Micractinium tetrahymenae]
MAVIYSKAWGGLHLLLRAYGSAIPRTLLASILSTALAALLFYVPGKDYFQGVWRHPYPYQLFAFLAGFILVFRSNLGYARFWEGRSQLQLLSAHWADAAVKSLTFEAVSASHAPAAGGAALSNDGRNGQGPAIHQQHRLDAFADRLLHSASLLHALCLQHLRRDWCLANLSAHEPGCPPPPFDARGLRGYRVGWLELLTLRTSGAARMRYHSAMPLAVLGGLSAEERRSLGEGREVAGGAETETLLTGLDQAFLQQPGGQTGALSRLSMRLELETGVVFEGANTRAISAYTWLHLLLGQAVPGWDLPPPSTAGVWLQLSQGWAAFEACRKLAESPFPFPWAQMVALLLLLYSRHLAGAAHELCVGADVLGPERGGARPGGLLPVRPKRRPPGAPAVGVQCTAAGRCSSGWGALHLDGAGMSAASIATVCTAS